MIPLRAFCVLILLIGLCVLDVGRAAAQADRAPRVRRTLTLDQGQLRIDAALFMDRIEVTVLDATVSEQFLWLTGGAGFGVTPDAEVGALPLALLLSPDFELGNPVLYGQYRFLRGNTELGARLDLSIPLRKGSHTVLTAGVPVLAHLGSTATLDTGLFLETHFASETLLNLRLPLEAVVRPKPDGFFVGGRLALVLIDMDPELLTVPVGLLAGYGLPGPTTVDLVGFFEFTELFSPGASEAFSVSAWVVGLAGRIYLSPSSASSSAAEPEPAAG
ncbi:MAG: hypothetical protein NZ898_01770 [Myxococcota bacterium]|nr:hypothetical protein [Myxococcota bacterium]MDW8363082.1 hypothetical protein [Myxococcales bacterium]